MRYASETDGVLVPQTGRRECELDHRHFPEIVRGRPRPSILPGMPPRSDGFIPPCIPTRAYRVPSAPGWVHEVKHDGYRLQAQRVGRLFHDALRYDFSQSVIHLHSPRIVGVSQHETVLADSFQFGAQRVGRLACAKFDANANPDCAVLERRSKNSGFVAAEHRAKLALHLMKAGQCGRFRALSDELSNPHVSGGGGGRCRRRRESRWRNGRPRRHRRGRGTRLRWLRRRRRSGDLRHGSWPGRTRGWRRRNRSRSLRRHDRGYRSARARHRCGSLRKPHRGRRSAPARYRCGAVCIVHSCSGG
jgi:hypothetical protein